MSRSDDTAGWDAVVVGSGLGGALAAHRLTEAGARVVVLERGRWPRRDEGDWNPRAILSDLRYRGKTPLSVRQLGDRRYRPLPMNETVGGMSVFYGGASLRLRPSDFDRWPFDYHELEPFYAEAERLLGVHGAAGADPLEPPRSGPYPFPSIPWAAPAERIRRAGERLGFRPFPIPLAINFLGAERPQCVRCNTCDGFPCAIDAKNDAAGILRRAEGKGLTVRSGIVVSRLQIRGAQAVGAECFDQESGETVSFEAPIFVLAAGALGSPAILLRSGLGGGGTDALPVGRCLMRHCNAVVAGLFPFRTNPEAVFHKQVCFTDFYDEVRERDGLAVGVIQDIYTPDAGVVRRAAGKVAGAFLAKPLVDRLQNLLCVAEDEPDPANRVFLGEETDAFGMERVRVEHRYRRADHDRLRLLVRRARKILRAAGALATHVWPISSFSHAVGTLRMGNEADHAALDPAGRVRGLDNLFVTDGSTFPASGGVNPSLTIAAGALRIADGIVNRRTS
ncbi:MAG: GMC family oxidoreductase [Acidobacteria bacterium]|nr:GMC family oxidoreductase [Acidobacteriota bacterium]MYA45621.1 GMC family oxidoreductase [Acidobacteriota bacterium]MYI37909.1 GMC family oxidoreductase [Acidobacteriota bacterium]